MATVEVSVGDKGKTSRILVQNLGEYSGATGLLSVHVRVAFEGDPRRSEQEALVKARALELLQEAITAIEADG